MNNFFTCIDVLQLIRELTHKKHLVAEKSFKINTELEKMEDGGLNYEEQFQIDGKDHSLIKNLQNLL